MGAKVGVRVGVEVEVVVEVKEGIREPAACLDAWPACRFFSLLTAKRYYAIQ